MTNSPTVSSSTRPFRSTSGTRQLIALFALAGLGMVGCAGGPGLEEEGLEDAAPAEVADLEASLIRGSGPTGLGYSCTSGVCTCDKSIENDCEDMSGVCRDADIDSLINCIDGWLTTHCTCRTARVAPKGGLPYVPPTGGVVKLQAY
jgi:hypothetical protein